MIKDVKFFVTKVEQKSEPTEDQSGDPLLPPVIGGSVIVTAQAEEGYLEFTAAIADRVAVGDEVHVRVDHAPTAS
jgi:hypothetical protein